jgi:hypothetical protein
LLNNFQLEVLDSRGMNFDYGQGQDSFILHTGFRPILEPNQSPIQWIPRALSLGGKLLGREADYSPESSAEVKNVRLYGVVLN